MKIGVVIPAYNAAKWLPHSVASVRAQLRQPDEFLVVDDGSTDDTREVCRHLGVPCVRRENGGLAAARNTGFSVTDSEWMLFLDADDALYPHSLGCLSEAAEKSDAGVVYGYVLQRQALATETRLHSMPYAVGDPPAPARAHFWWTAVSTAGSALIRRSLDREIGGFDESFRQVEDADYWLRCGVTAPFAHCGQIVLDKTFIPSSLGQQQDTSIWFRLQLQLKFLDWCASRRIDTSFLDASLERMVDHALTRTYRQEAWPVLGPLLKMAAKLGVRTPWYWRALLRYRALQMLGKQPPASPRCVEVYQDWKKSLIS